MLVLEKKIPARTVRYVIEWVNPDFAKMSARFREIRAGSRNKMNKCWWCSHQFEDGQIMGLVSIKGQPNRVVCQCCCDEMVKGAVMIEEIDEVME